MCPPEKSVRAPRSHSFRTPTPPPRARPGFPFRAARQFKPREPKRSGEAKAPPAAAEPWGDHERPPPPPPLGPGATPSQSRTPLSSPPSSSTLTPPLGSNEETEPNPQAGQVTVAARRHGCPAGRSRRWPHGREKIAKMTLRKINSSITMTLGCRISVSICVYEYGSSVKFINDRCFESHFCKSLERVAHGVPFLQIARASGVRGCPVA